jgi:hypothetical protein
VGETKVEFLPPSGAKYSSFIEENSIEFSSIKGFFLKTKHRAQNKFIVLSLGKKNQAGARVPPPHVVLFVI